VHREPPRRLSAQRPHPGRRQRILGHHRPRRDRPAPGAGHPVSGGAAAARERRRARRSGRSHGCRRDFLTIRATSTLPSRWRSRRRYSCSNPSSGASTIGRVPATAADAESDGLS